MANAGEGLQDGKWNHVRPGSVEEFNDLLGGIDLDLDRGKLGIVHERKLIPCAGKLVFSLGKSDELTKDGEAIFSGAKADVWRIEVRRNLMGAQSIEPAGKFVRPEFEEGLELSQPFNSTAEAF